MPLEHAAVGTPGFGRNVKTEMNAGKPQKQAVAIAYSKARGDAEPKSSEKGEEAGRPFTVHVKGEGVEHKIDLDADNTEGALKMAAKPGSWLPGEKADATGDEDPKELRKKAGMLRSLGYGKMADELIKQAEALEKRKDADTKGWKREAQANRRSGEKAARRGDTAFERGLEDNQPRVVIGVKGAKSKPFRRRFANAQAMDRWFDSDEAGDVDVQYVRELYR